MVFNGNMRIHRDARSKRRRGRAQASSGAESRSPQQGPPQPRLPQQRSGQSHPPQQRLPQQRLLPPAPGSEPTPGNLGRDGFSLGTQPPGPQPPGFASAEGGSKRSRRQRRDAQATPRSSQGSLLQWLFRRPSSSRPHPRTSRENHTGTLAPSAITPTTITPTNVVSHPRLGNPPHSDRSRQHFQGSHRPGFSAAPQGGSVTPLRRRGLSSEGTSQPGAITLHPNRDRASSGRVGRPGLRSVSSQRLGEAQGRRSLRSLGQSPRNHSRHDSRRDSRPSGIISPLLYGLRLLIVGVGLGVIAGTLLSSLNPSLQVAQDPLDPNQPNAVNPVNGTATAGMKGFALSQEMAPLKVKLAEVSGTATDLTPGVFVLDLDTGGYVDLNGDRAFPSASMIKLPILVAFFQAVDAGTLSLDEPLTMRPELIAKEAGEMQFQAPGSQFTALQTATEMVRTSDNTATNMLIDRLGGIAQLNQTFQSWGLSTTVLRNPLPDIEGTNTTSPRELVMLLSRVSQGEGDLLSLRSRDRLLSILRSTELNDLLPQGLGEGAAIAHKTGRIAKVVGDVGAIDMPSGKRYLIMTVVERTENDPRAEEMIRRFSQETYQFLATTATKSEMMMDPIDRSNIAQKATPNLAPSSLAPSSLAPSGLTP